MLEIIIDNRETRVYNDIIKRDLDKYKNDISIISKQIDLGDIIIKYNELIFVFERKTVNDLLASIKDGRYKEQKYRLKSNFKNISYIIEGDDIISSNSNQQNILTSAYIHSIYRDNINLVFTKNIQQTVSYLLIFCSKILEHPEHFINTNNNTNNITNDNDNTNNTNNITNDNTNNDINNKEYYEICKIKSKKSDNITPESCYLFQLSQIPSINIKIAQNIKNKYPTMKILLDNLTNSDNPINLLTNIDKIGKEKANNIIKFLQL